MHWSSVAWLGSMMVGLAVASCAGSDTTAPGQVAQGGSVGPGGSGGVVGGGGGTAGQPASGGGSGGSGTGGTVLEAGDVDAPRDVSSDPSEDWASEADATQEWIEGGCSDGSCDAGVCDPGKGDCDGDPANGCETDTTVNASHCGACGNACLPGQYCAAGKCQSKSGSCPYVFLWDKGTYRYYTDLSGSPLAKGLSFFRPSYYGINIYELGDWQADLGIFRMRLRELIFEASYFDHALLLVADVPEGYGVYNEWSLTSQLERAPSRRFVTVRNPRVPVAARAASGEDVLKEVSAADGIPLAVAPGGLSRVEVDFGVIEHPERARLLVTTWGVYADWRAQQSPPYSAGTVIETRDDRGEWQQRVVAGKSASDARTWAIDLGGVLKRDDSRLRITLAHQSSTIDVLDAVRLDDSAQVPIRLTKVAPRIGQLWFYGAAHAEAATLTHRIRAEDVQRPIDPEALLEGNYTRYGDVRPLLAKADDRFVIMGQGDELYLEFDAPPQQPKTTRRAFLQADVFYTLKYHPFGTLTTTIDPLPFHGMKSYPYPAEQWPYTHDASYQRYLKEWNTRVLSP